MDRSAPGARESLASVIRWLMARSQRCRFRPGGRAAFRTLTTHFSTFRVVCGTVLGGGAPACSPRARVEASERPFPRFVPPLRHFRRRPVVVSDVGSVPKLPSTLSTPRFHPSTGRFCVSSTLRGARWRPPPGRSTGGVRGDSAVAADRGDGRECGLTDLWHRRGDLGRPAAHGPVRRDHRDLAEEVGRTRAGRRQSACYTPARSPWRARSERM
jgi:hypothetical protein